MPFKKLIIFSLFFYNKLILNKNVNKGNFFFYFIYFN